MTNPKDTIPGMTWFSNANASASSVPTNLFAALSDPTDTHSLEELRAHLEDGGDIDVTDSETDAEIGEMILAFGAEMQRQIEILMGKGKGYEQFKQQQASERSGGDGA